MLEKKKKKQYHPERMSTGITACFKLTKSINQEKKILHYENMKMGRTKYLYSFNLNI